MMLTELQGKARQPGRIILTGRTKPSRKRIYMDKKEPVVRKHVRILWTAWRDGLTRTDAAFLLQQPTIQPYLRDRWLGVADEWLASELNPQYEKAIQAAIDGITAAYKRTKEAEFNLTYTNILEWVREHGGELIKELTEAQALSINALLQHQAFMGISSPGTLANMLKPMVGLLKREALAVTNYRAELVAQGMQRAKVESMSERYADFLLRARTERIARTELAYAYEYGQLETVRQLRDGGFVDDVEKEWIASGDERMCDICASLNGEKVGMNENFSIGVEAPPAHPGCRCDVGYSAIKR